jgi:hypothetical protein
MTTRSLQFALVATITSAIFSVATPASTAVATENYPRCISKQLGIEPHKSFVYKKIQWADSQYRESGFDGAKTVNVHREDYLRDWQTHMDWAKEALPTPLPGDFKVDGADLTDPITGWEARFGVDLDGGDFLIWQRNITGPDDGLGAGTVVPKPSTALLLGALLCMATTIRSKRWFVYLAIGAIWFGDPAAGSAQPRDLYSDTWVATDSLGRTLPGYSEVGPPRENKTVAMFYFLWQGEHGTGGPYDVTELLADNLNNPAWGPEGDFHHWGQSELGYYLSDDEYVMRKHAHMLADAGVDVIIFDITNGFTYKDNYMALSSVFMDIRANGGTTPQIAFMANGYADQAVQSIYNDLYRPGIYSDLWFDWKGKPLVLTPLDGMVVNGRTINHSQQVLDFFNMRYSWTWMDIENPDVWKWMDYYPQQYGWHESSSIPEQISVSAGMVPHGSGVGRSYQNGSQPPDDEYDLTGTEDQGYFFAEQWSRLDTIDPEFLFITGWNEWVAQRQVFTGSGDPVTHFTGDPLEAGDTWFIDAYNQEYSRDIEPMKGGHTDNYYYQMIDGIRRYKGVRQPQSSSPPTTIAIDGNFMEWDPIGPEYRDTLGDTAHRDHDGWGSLHYTNTTGRNDFLTGKVTNDAEDVYFYVETQESITPHTDQNWMMLFIDTDRDSETGWNGYDFVANRSVVDSDTTTLMSTSDGQTWTLVDSLDYAVSGNMLELRIPRTVIGQDASAVSLNFHWADNMQTLDDIAEFFVNGDSAPNRRFDYHYESLPLLGDFGMVDRTHGQSGDRLPIGAFDGETNPLSSPTGGIELGMTAYSDRDYAFDSVDAPLVGAAWVRTFNTDKSPSENDVHYQVTLLEDTFVMVLMDDRFGEDQQTMVDQVVGGFAAAGLFANTDWDISLNEPEEYDFSAFGALLSAGIYDFGPNPTSSLSFYMIAARALVDGDFNMDFDVDDADLAIWRTGFGTQTGAAREQGDADGDADVDGADFLTWQRQLGSSIPAVSASTGVPEPAAWIMLMLGMVVIMFTGGRTTVSKPIR